MLLLDEIVYGVNSIEFTPDTRLREIIIDIQVSDIIKELRDRKDYRKKL